MMYEEENKKKGAHAASSVPKHRKRRMSRRTIAIGAAAVMVAALLAVPSVAVAQGGALPAPLQGIASFFGLTVDAPQTQAALSQESVVDASSIDGWKQWELSDTASVGRIWTDKTVSNNDITLSTVDGAASHTIAKADGSDFLTVLSAIASSSNVSSVNEVPLDIVLVLDASGSMDDPMGTTYTYTPTYDVSRWSSSDYYVLVNGSYQQVSYDDRRNGWGYGDRRNWTTVTPKTSANDTDASHTQFYTRTTNNDSTKRIDALTNAAGSFVDAIAQQNAGISDAAKQHQVSVVKFAGDKSNYIGNDTYISGGYRYNYSQVMRLMGECTTGTANSIKNTINSIEPAGATRADYGLQLAQGQTSGRSDAKKVVIFFTDGQPTSNNQFEGAVANSAITAAKAMKDAGATIYSIGIMAGADSSDTTGQTNAFMHAVSSNYPNASSYTNLGTRASNSDFYKSATNADELNRVFAELAEKLASGSGLPTSTTEGAEHESGYVTFDDQLGAYMQVDSFGPIVFANQEFGSPTEKTEDIVDAAGNVTGSVVTYTFEGEAGNILYPSGNLSNIIIEVTKSNDPATGDHVAVKIPATLIPLRLFSIDTDADAMGVTDAYPIRLFYNSSLKSDAKDGLANPDSALSSYLSSNTEKNGKAAFYANAWTPNVSGDTIATFDPSKGNSYYYFTRDTPLYTDEACTQRATSIQAGETYYYVHSYYKLDSGKPVQEIEHPSFNGSYALDLAGSYGYDEAGNYYLKAGTPRLIYIDQLHTAKNPNATETGVDIINPDWSGANTIEDATTINVHLGNNGKLLLELPGTLAVSKTVTVPEGYSIDTVKDTGFNFTVNIPNAAGKKLSAEVKNAAGVTQGDAFELAFDAQGNATHSLKHGETLYIYDLSANDAYTVSENDVPSGFTQVSPVSESGAATSATGVVVAGTTAHESFTNAYSAQGTLSGSESLAGEKVFKGRDWTEDDEFTFELSAAEGTPLPLDAQGNVVDTVTVRSTDATNGTASFHFGDIVYETPGTYTYLIKEPAHLNTPGVGVSLSRAAYEVTVTVEDNGTGAFDVSSVMKCITNDDGETVSENADIASFTNEFDATTEKWSPVGIKSYTDSGANALTSGMFSFRLTAIDGAPMPAGAVDGAIVSGVLADHSVPFADIEFTASMVGNTYYYTVTEVVQNDAGEWEAVKDAITPTTVNGQTVYVKDGMTYDPTAWTIKVEVSSELVDGTPTVVVTPTYTKQGSSDAAAGFEFANSYEPDQTTLEGDAFVAGNKTLTGRDMLAGETFGFTLTPDTATAAAIEAGSVVLSGDGSATVSGAEINKATGFNFGNATFKKPGVYTFTVAETSWNGEALPADAPATAAKGLTFDRQVYTVVVTVTDNKAGKLSASVSYQNAAGATLEGPAAFTNTYEASINYGAAGGVKVSKTLTGRTMAAEEFDFTITGAAGTGTTAADANAKLAAADRQFSNTQQRLSGVAEAMAKLRNVTFNQNDAGKTFVYEVREVVPAADDKIPGVTYDESVYQVSIAVSDNGDGTMTTVTTIKKNGESFATYTFSSAADATNAVPTDAVMAFSNTYRADSVDYDSADFSLAKILEGRDWESTDTFTFDLTKVSFNGDDDETALAQMPEPATNPVTVTGAKADGTLYANGDKVPFDFGKLTFAQAGTYVYKVTEQSGSLSGITYSNNVAEITIVVMDNTDLGKLEVVSVETTGGSSEFSNVYEPEQVTLEGDAFIKGSKTLTGRDMLTDETFEFSLDAADEATKAAIASDSVIFNNADRSSSSVSGGKDGVAESFNFGDATFTEPGTYTFKVKEARWNGSDLPAADAPDEAAKGLTFDRHECTVTITVTDDKGQLKATVAYDNAAAGSSTSEAAFFNTYRAGSVEYDSVSLDLNKVFSGRNWTANDSFTFDVAKVSLDGATTDEALSKMPNPVTPVTVTGTKADGSLAVSGESIPFNFGKLTFTQAGTYVYQVREQGAGQNANGITYSNNTAVITITVTDNTATGKLEASASITSGEKAFTNTYTSTMPDDEEAKTGFDFKKILSGRDWLDTDEFEFVLTADNGAPLPSPTTVKVTKSNVNGAFAFGQINYTYDMVKDEPNREKTFVYHVSEVVPADADKIPGVTYDGKTITVTVTVTDDGKGKLLATVSYSDPTKTFTNTYASTLDYGAAGGLSIAKTLNGHAMSDGQFSYTVTPADAASAEKLGLTEGANTVSTPAGADGAQVLKAITAAEGVTFTQADAGKTYTYTISEVNDGKPGYTYDASEYTVTITTEDDPDNAKLTVTTVVSRGETVVGTYTYTTGETAAAVAVVPFVNSYAATGTLPGATSLAGQKIFSGRAWNSTDSFTFTIAAETAGAPMPAETSVTVDKTKADAEGKALFNFGNIAYTQADAGKTYTYIIAETMGSIAGVNYSQAVYRVTVTVQDNNDGTLNVSSVMTPVKNDAGETVEVSGDSSTVALARFTNSFNADTLDAAFAGVKNYTDNSGMNPLEPGKFSFRLTAKDDAPMPAGATGATDQTTNYDAQTSDAVNSAIFTGNVSFGSIPFTAAMVGNTYEYTIEEVIPSGATAANGYALNGMKYDPSVWTVRVTVGSETVDGDNGGKKEVVKLTITYSKDGQLVEGATGFEFSNVYTPTSVAVPAGEFVKGSKTLDGRDMKSGETFGFTLAPAGEEVDGGKTAAAIANGSVALDGTTAQVSGATNGVAQGFEFGDATFTKPGTYTFTVAETSWNGNAVPASDTAGITFDRGTWTVTVVIDDKDGALECSSITYAKGEATGTEAAFTNVYTTGDVTYDTVSVSLKKAISGRDWLDADSFTFTIEAVTDGAPMPKSAAGEDVSEVTVTPANKDAFSFGNITYTFNDVKGSANNTKTFTYKVTEVVPAAADKLAGMTYDTKTIYIDVTVTDNGDGTLSATGVVRDDNGIAGDDDTFTNVYASGLDYVAAGGLKISKTLTGHAMADGQFSYTVTPVASSTVTAAEAAAKLGLATGANSFSTPGADAGATSSVDVLAGKTAQFTQADAGKTYVYKVVEVNAGSAGYTYDTVERTVTITVSDNPATAKLTVTTTVTGGPSGTKTFTYVTDETPTAVADVPFVNSYSASTDVPGGTAASVSATKTLTGRPLAAGEFSFAVKYAGAAAGEGVVATATNKADGSIDFGSFSYTTETLADLVDSGRATKSMNADGKTVWTIQYTAYENTTGLSDKGVTPTKSSFDFVVTVVDNNDGTLTATAATSDTAGFAFANEYGTDSKSVALNGSKVLLSEGFTPDAIAGKFTFTVSAKTAGAPMPKNAAGEDVAEVKNDAQGNVSFGSITFTLDDLNKALASAGTSGRSFVFEYEITESGTVEGVTNDSDATKTVSFRVTDNGDGTLTVERVSAGDAAFVFTNTYVPSAASATIEGTKTLTGRDMKPGETFDFTLAAADDATKEALTDGSMGSLNSLLGMVDPVKVTGGADGQSVGFNFGTATFNKPGTYTFTVQETGWNGMLLSSVADKQGLTFDGHTCTVTIVVTDNGKGALSAQVTYSDGSAAVFNNSYFAEMPDTEKVKTSASFTKVLEGRDWLDSDSFTFKLEPIDGAPMPVDEEGNVVDTVTVDKNNAANFTFGEIAYTFGMVKDEPNRSKTFQYKVTEVAGSAAGIEYATNEATLSITVRDNTEGELVATVELANSTFTNKYSSGLSYTAAGGLKLTKVLSGRDMAEGQFEFTVTPVDKASADKLGFAEGENEFAAPAASDGQTATIDLLAGKNIQFTQEDAGITYTYTIAEKHPAGATAENGYTVDGYTYDVSQRTVVITTVDDPETATLTVTTKVSGGPEGTQTFTYETDKTPEATAVVPFANSYFASTDEPGGASAEVEATKELTGRPLEEGEFSFGVKYANAADDEADVDAAVNVADGKVVFGEFGHYTTKTLAGLVSAGHAVKGTTEDGKAMWTVGYIAYEKTDGLADEGVSATRPAFNFAVTVVDNNDGTLTATAQPVDDTGYLFRNVYSTGDPIEIGLAGRKVLELAQDGLTPDDITGKFTFTLEAVTEGAPMPTTDVAQNDENGVVSFGSIVFTLEDLNKALESRTDAPVEIQDASADKLGDGAGDADAVVEGSAAGEFGEASGAGEGDGYQPAAKAGVDAKSGASAEAEAASGASSNDYIPYAGIPRSADFVYHVTESGDVPGITNDADNVKTITFRVTDDGKGHLTVQPLFEDGIAFTFTNSYDVEPKGSSVTDQLKVVKTLTGRDMNAGEFAFELVENNEVVATATNGADGSIEFGSLTYTAPGVHHYTIREVKAGTTEAGVTYDGTTFAVKTVVLDNGDGTLSVEHAFEGELEFAEFANVYRPNPTSVALGTAKVLTGKSLADGQFTFRLTGDDGTSLEAKNTASGQVLFPAVTFDKVGVYQYVISEVNDGQANITYDESTHGVTVKVTDDSKGNLVADIAYADGVAPVFKNTYTPPAPKSNLSKTGDNLGGLMGAAAAVAAVAAGAAGVAYKRTRKRDEQ